MGLMSQMYIPYCCFVYITEKNKYLTKIIKCDEELIIKKIGSIDVFKEKIKKSELFEKDVYLYERSQNGSEIYFWECQPMKKDKFADYVPGRNPIDVFLAWVKEEFM